MNSFTASEAKVQFGERLSQAMRDHVSITKNCCPKAVMMSWEKNRDRPITSSGSAA
ncbi:type II toxin-antitoxin system prevent-host-death family antitoxin [Winslowiella toletana]|uniref:type II toxin-antitoxin system prevent-host-death family antitoxin n=1 Tax=Winslowiella toletana TaxID=92490 RepID=UPI0028BE4B35|nr:type II toxin-antitoxin system prevent-host-death family antitoxin [Winslowiella toletana]WNN46704.1 type II toxin-antitoxin system prevent-host-death family antitoxin [Winslowiella toletana]